jgi:hypothetical protein
MLSLFDFSVVITLNRVGSIIDGWIRLDRWRKRRGWERVNNNKSLKAFLGGNRWKISWKHRGKCEVGWKNCDIEICVVEVAEVFVELWGCL